MFHRGSTAARRRAMLPRKGRAAATNDAPLCRSSDTARLDADNDGGVDSTTHPFFFAVRRAIAVFVEAFAKVLSSNGVFGLSQVAAGPKSP